MYLTLRTNMAATIIRTRITRAATSVLQTLATAIAPHLHQDHDFATREEVSLDIHILREELSEEFTDALTDDERYLDEREEMTQAIFPDDHAIDIEYIEAAHYDRQRSYQDDDLTQLSEVFDAAKTAIANDDLDTLVHILEDAAETWAMQAADEAARERQQFESLLDETRSTYRVALDKLADA